MKSRKTLSAETLLYCIGRQGATANLNLAPPADRRQSRSAEGERTLPDRRAAHLRGRRRDRLSRARRDEHGAGSAGELPHVQAVRRARPQTLFPYGIYTIPEISMVGDTEQALTEAENPVRSRHRPLSRDRARPAHRRPARAAQALFHPQSRRLLGVHAIGTGATELIHIGQAVMAAGMPIDYFIEAIFNYPTLAECYKVAALDGVNRVRSPKVGVVEISEPASKQAA